jgi:tripartite-type tricarboxylate transporter receptor subunit TctC
MVMAHSIKACLGILGLAIVVAGSQAMAQAAYPSKAITIVVPFSPGSGADLAARNLSKDMTQALKQPVIVSNRPGANGAIGAAFAANSAPDGYTLLLGSGTTQAANFAFRIGNMGYSTTSFEMISGLGASPVVMYVAGNSSITSVPALVSEAKKNIGRLSCSSGNAVTEVACEVFKKRAAIFAPTIPYRSNAQSLQDLAGGQISFTFSDPSAALALVESKRIRPLAVAAAKRMTIYPDVPTFAELGYKDMEITAWTGLFAPKGTPREVLDTLNAIVKTHAGSDDSAKLLARIGSSSLWMPLDQSKKFLEAEVSKWDRYVKSTGIKPYM